MIKWVKDLKEVNEILQKYLRSYSNNNNKIELEEWLYLELKSDFPEEADENLKSTAKELIEGVNKFSKIKEELNKQKQFGISNSHFIGDKIIENIEIIDNDHEKTKEYLEDVARQLEEDNVELIYETALIAELEDIEKDIKKLSETENITSIEFETTDDDGNKQTLNVINNISGILGASKSMNYIDGVANTIDVENAKTISNLLNKDGSINMNKNLDGFLAEEYHRATYNIDAVVKKSSSRAEALKPKEGETYGKNSVDIVIKDGGKIVRKYQSKYGKNEIETSKAFIKGNYRGQRKLTPSGQDVSNSTDKISYDGVESKALSKEEAVRKTKEFQKGNKEVVCSHFNDLNTISLAKQIGKDSLVSAGYGFAAGMGADIVKKIINDEEIEASEVIEAGIKSSATAGISTAFAGGLKSCVKKELITGRAAKFLSNNVHCGLVASSALGIISTAYHIGAGDLSLGDGIKTIGEELTCSYAGFIGAGLGKALALTALGGLGGVLGGVVALGAGAIGGLIGSNTAKAIYNGIVEIKDEIVDTVKSVVKSGAEAVASVASGIWEGVKSVGSAIGGVFSSIGSGIASFFGW